jgi:3-phenylpropionate/trans-cinnamate dioxygenase ferredoxin reductase subunit
MAAGSNTASSCSPPARPRPSCASPGADRENVYYLRTVDDSMKIRDAAKQHKRAVMIGAGFVGTEVSASLTDLGVKCAMIGRENRLWDKFLSEKSGSWLARYFQSKGVDVRLNSTTTEITDRGVKLESGEEIEGDIVVVGVGVKLNLGLAIDAGLEMDGHHGVVVDSSLRTSDPNIWAAGDIAAYEDVNFGKRWHLEHYMNADWQGSHVGKSMTGANDPFDKVPYFFSDMFDLHFVLRGDPQGGESAKVIGDIESGEFTELYAYPDGRLAMGIVFTRDGDRQDQVGDKLEEYLLAKRNVAELSASDFP